MEDPNLIFEVGDVVRITHISSYYAHRLDYAKRMNQQGVITYIHGVESIKYRWYEVMFVDFAVQAFEPNELEHVSQ